MNTITFEAFKIKCQEGMCLRHTLISKVCKKIFKQQSCYLKYQKKIEKNSVFEKDEKWEEVKKIVYERDNNECQLIKKLSKETKELFLKKVNPQLVNIIDPAHYLSTGSYPEYKYDPDVILLLNRQSHTWIDCQCSPVTGRQISIEEKEWWWEFLLGKERKDRLDKLKNKG
jgi:hypothetical protein